VLDFDMLSRRRVNDDLPGSRVGDMDAAALAKHLLQLGSYAFGSSPDNRVRLRGQAAGWRGRDRLAHSCPTGRQEQDLGRNADKLAVEMIFQGVHGLYCFLALRSPGQLASPLAM
jgi:hypothetical protein